MRVHFHLQFARFSDIPSLQRHSKIRFVTPKPPPPDSRDSKTLPSARENKAKLDMAAQLQLPQPTVDVPGHIPSQAAELYQMTGSGTNLESRLPPLEQSKESGLVLDFSFAKDSELALTLLYPPHSPTRVFPILSKQDRIHTPHSQFGIWPHNCGN